MLNRLDKETKWNYAFLQKRRVSRKNQQWIKANRVYKEYINCRWKSNWWGEIDKPILTTKDEDKQKSKVDKKGKPAKSTVYPMFVEGNKSKLKL